MIEKAIPEEDFKGICFRALNFYDPVIREQSLFIENQWFELFEICLEKFKGNASSVHQENYLTILGGNKDLFSEISSEDNPDLIVNSNKRLLHFLQTNKFRESDEDLFQETKKEFGREFLFKKGVRFNQN